LVFSSIEANQCTEFAQGKVDPVEAGKKGGNTSGGSADSDESGESGGKGQFAGGKVDPVEAGKKGGNS
jgi:general stress protein YciG